MDVPDWAQEPASPPDWATAPNEPDSGGIRMPADNSGIPMPPPPTQANAAPQPQQASPQLAQAAQAAASPPAEQKPGMWEGVKRGAQQFDIGSRQLSADLLKAAGIQVDPAAEQALDKGAQTLNDQGKGTGLAGTVGEAIGDPLTYVPGIGTEKILGSGFKAGAKAAGKEAAKLGLLGGSSALTAASEDDQGLGARGSNAVESGLLSTVAAPVAHYAGQTVGKLGKGIADSTGLSDLVTSIGAKLGAKPTGTDVYEMAKQAGIPTDGRGASQIYEDLQKWYANSISDAASTVGNTNFDPLNGMADISNSFNAAKQKSNELYGVARQNGEGKTTEANGLQKQLSNTISSLASKEFRTKSEDAALSKLQDVQSNLGWAPRPKTATIETGETLPSTGFQQAQANKPATTTYQEINQIGYNDLVDLKQALNESFNGSKFAGKGDRPMAQLYNNVKDALGRAGEEDSHTLTQRMPDGTVKTQKISPFGDALAEADRHYSDDLAPTYLNDTLKKFWGAEDHNDYMTSQGWSRRAPNVDTTAKADKMLDNIKSPSDLQAVTQAMSPTQAADLSATWFQKKMSDAGLDGDEIAKNYTNMKFALQGNKQASALLDQIKNGVDAMNARGIGDNARFFDKSNPDIMKNAVMGAVALKAGRPLYALKSLLNVLGKNGTAVERRIKGFANEVNSGAPAKSLLNPAVNAIGTQAGKQTAIDLGDTQNQSQVRRSAPPFARGGRVNKYGKAVGILSD